MTANRDLSIIDYLLRKSLHPPDTISAFNEWKQSWTARMPDWITSADRALAGGIAADRPAWAFAAGYQAAIQCLMDPAGIDGIAAICITEKGGPHPARIKSRITPLPGTPGKWRLDGTKSFVSGAEGIDILWIAASVGKTPEGRNLLRMARLPAKHPGVTIVPLPPLSIVPEIPHARVLLDSVILSDNDILSEDGYQGAAKPFRTIEDLHVTAAFLAWIFGVGRRSDWPGDILEVLLSLIVSTRCLALEPPLEAHVHIALGGLLDQFHHLLARIEPWWKNAGSTIRDRWHRDRKILEIASMARRIRLNTAWRHYGV